MPDDLELDDNYLNIPDTIDLDRAVAFEHPSRPGTVVFIMADMPHLVKRIVNVLEYSNPNNGHKRSLEKPVKEGDVTNLHPLCLAMEEAIHEVVGECIPGKIGVSKWTPQHFHKDCWSRMRCPLAFQVVSKTAADLMEGVVESEHCPPGISRIKKSYEALIELCRKVDRLVDIMNSDGRKIQFPMINSTNHCLLEELVGILDYFTIWRAELLREHRALETSFLTAEIWRDLHWMILGLASSCQFYLSKNGAGKGGAIVQRRLNQDPAEHHFAHVRQAGGGSSNTNAWQSCSATATSSQTRAIHGGRGRTNCTEHYDAKFVLNMASTKKQKKKKIKIKKKSHRVRCIMEVGVY